MDYECNKIPGYDLHECEHEHSEGHFRVWVRGVFLPVCENAYRFARLHRMMTSKGGSQSGNVPISEKNPGIVLNHRV